MHPVLKLPEAYPLPVGAALAMSWQLWWFGHDVANFRKEVFNEDFMKKEFGAKHQEEIGEEIKSGGYPDIGSGLYTDKLDYR
jgi:hypothetical protein